MTKFTFVPLLLVGLAACAGPHRSLLPRDASNEIVDAARGCDRGESGACEALAIGYWTGNGVPADIDAAVGLLRSICPGASPEACALSEEVRLPVGASASVVASAARCDRRDAVACAELGDAYWTGTAGQLDRDRGQELYGRACMAGVTDACSRTHEQRVGSSAAPNVVAAARACDRDDSAGCVELGWYWFADASSPHHARGVGLLETACRNGDVPTCAELGRRVLVGEGVASDVGRAVELLRVACSAGDSTSCARSRELELPANPSAAAVGAARACDRGDAVACETLAAAWVDGTAGRTDLERAAAIYEPVCAQGRATACTALAELRRRGIGGPAANAQAADLFGTACDAGQMRACFELGSLYRNGDGIPRDALRAYSLWERACRGGEAAACEALPGPTEQRLPDTTTELARNLASRCDENDYAACTELAGLWLQGTGLPRDRVEGRRLLVRACFSGHEPACSVVVYPGPCTEESLGAGDALAGTRTRTWDLDRLAVDGQIEPLAPRVSAVAHTGVPTAPEGGRLPEIDPRVALTWERAVDPNRFVAGTVLVPDEASRRVLATDPAGVSVTLTFDADGRIVRIEEPEAARTATTSFTWGAGGRLTEQRTDRGSAESVTSFEYDAAGRPIVATLVSPTTGARTESRWTYSYDTSGEMTEMVVETVSFNARGAEASRVYRQHRRIYDARGNLMRTDVRNENREVLEATNYGYACFPGGI